MNGTKLLIFGLLSILKKVNQRPPDFCLSHVTCILFPAAFVKKADYNYMTKKDPHKKQLTLEQALQKLKHYCAYQERCHSEVKEKLYSLGVFKKEADNIIAKLIEEGYLDEERFAIAFAGGKFRIKQWGRVKIKYELKGHLQNSVLFLFHAVVFCEL